LGKDIFLIQNNMHSKINKIIEEWIGEDEEEVIGNRTGRGAKSVTKVIQNKLRQDLRNKSPQLTEEIVKLIDQAYQQGAKDKVEEVRREIWGEIVKLAEPDERQFGAGDLNTHLDVIHDIIFKR